MSRGRGATAAIASVLLGVGAASAGVPAGAAGAADASSPPIARGDQLGTTEDEGRGDVFAPGPGQEYELAFFITAAVLTVLVAGAFVVVIIVHGRGSHASDREAAPDEIEA